ncbi:type II toxin-antitoxin system death-on-curing family toxin [Prosthecomicrobium pneumaticum]|uniref:Death-on-curing protein n=1 Tax=Prosthecomicrobium pneumaticum TaxID=81895 RepID=A0A7W9CWA8_9HYPH|nr:type II toxin-antitoxin system death-on-curing family toxin [Prosthecomicrobium pneumaticum]MBB5752537.1 death-on-curing protein [Prosthecomicrobium pneumaticum]
MSEPRWLREEEIRITHERQLARFGGAIGIRDVGALRSALDRPRNKWAYEQADLVTLGAAYAFGIARNHPFVDGNKRVAFLAMIGFLRLNGVRFAPPPAEATGVMLKLAAGEIDEAGLVRWIADSLAKSAAAP